jgi:hypothetical protein
MTDNFDFKKFLMENKLGAYSKAGKLNEDLGLDPGNKRGSAQDLGAEFDSMNMGDDSDMPMDEPKVGDRILTDDGESYVVKRIEQKNGEDVYIVDAPSGRAGLGASEFTIPFNQATLHPQQLSKHP